jgi:hypothetical protein
MNGHPISVGGIPLPSDGPLFLATIAAHIAAGLVCVAAGAVAMLSRKAPGRHPFAGGVYFWSLSVVFVTMSVVSAVRWTADQELFALGLLSFAAAIFGREARRRRWPGWVRLHMTGMGGSYILLLTAFYVDNGKNLPLWRLLPEWAFWGLPSAIGLPILTWALLRHPSTRNST